MKKIILLISGLVLFTFFYFFITHDSREKMYLLNWGEYIDDELLLAFEEKYNVEVVYEEVGSSEAMYTKVKSGTTKYDVVIPGDYIIQKMYDDDLLEKIDHSLLTNYKDDMFVDDLMKVMEKDDFYKDALNYSIPYFWGAYSILYRTDNEDIVNSVVENGFNVFMDSSLTPQTARIGMYDVPRWATACYLLANGKSINDTNIQQYENDVLSKMSSVKYNLWADDMLKKSIAANNLDIAFTQLGDFFDQYYVSTEDKQEIKFNAYIPDNTAAFYDGLVIPKTSNNKDVAYKFIDFFLDVDNATQNALYVGYCPTIKEVVEEIQQDEEMIDFVEAYPFYLNPLQGKNAVLFNNLGKTYDSYVITLINKVKNN